MHQGRCEAKCGSDQLAAASLARQLRSLWQCQPHDQKTTPLSISGQPILHSRGFIGYLLDLDGQFVIYKRKPMSLVEIFDQ